LVFCFVFLFRFWFWVWFGDMEVVLGLVHTFQGRLIAMDGYNITCRSRIRHEVKY
jgi:hypothetical protein